MVPLPPHQLPLVVLTLVVLLLVVVQQRWAPEALVLVPVPGFELGVLHGMDRRHGYKQNLAW